MKKKSLLVLFLAGIGALLPLAACQDTGKSNCECKTVQAGETPSEQDPIAEEKETVSEEAAEELQ